MIELTRFQFNDYQEFNQMVDDIDLYKEPIQAIYHENIFEAVYSTNQLLRKVDLLVTKPSELAFDFCLLGLSTLPK